MAPVLGIWASSFNSRTFQPTGSYDALATYTVPSGGVSSITFAGIPSTYTHLEIRGINLSTGTDGADLGIRFNSDSSNSYALHLLAGNGSSAFAGAAANASYGLAGTQAGATYPNASVTTVLDYANTSKNKTVRSLSGSDLNGSGRTGLYSGLWLSTSAITSITLLPQTGNFAQYSQFSLYGVKG
jgi:hypothetical protein